MCLETLVLARGSNQLVCSGIRQSPEGRPSCLFPRAVSLNFMLHSAGVSDELLSLATHSGIAQVAHSIEVPRLHIKSEK